MQIGKKGEKVQSDACWFCSVTLAWDAKDPNYNHGAKKKRDSTKGHSM